MSGASIETTLELWASSLRDVKGRMRPLFTQARVALSAEFSRGFARRGAAQDRLDAGGGGWRSWSVAATGHFGSGPTKGERLHDWTYLELADLNGGDYNEALVGQEWMRGLLIRRKIADGDIAFFTT